MFFGSGRWLRLLGVRAGQPWTAAFAVSFRAVGRWAAIPPRASQAPCPNNNSPDRSSSPCPGAPRMRRFYISARELRTLAARDSISSVLHAASNPFCSRRFSDLRDTEAKRTAQRSPNTPRVLRAESRATFSCVKRLHTANKQGALCERCVTARDVDARYKQDGVKPWAAAKQSTASPTTTRGKSTRTTKTAGDSCGCEA